MHRLLLCLGALFLTSACGGIRFQNAWSNYEPRAGRGALEGRWRGEWRSEWNGHSGGLRCLLTPQDEAHVQAWFYSTYATLLFFQHELVFDVRAEPDGSQHFEGEKDLGEAIGGVYRYVGTVSGDDFHATFEAQNGDHGVFEMRRVE